MHCVAQALGRYVRDATDLGRSDEQKSESRKLVVKFEAVLSPSATAVAGVEQPAVFPTLFETFASLAFPPPTPPPLA